jgi:hypothetical protein
MRQNRKKSSPKNPQINRKVGLYLRQLILVIKKAHRIVEWKRIEYNRIE